MDELESKWKDISISHEPFKQQRINICPRRGLPFLLRARRGSVIEGDNACYVYQFSNLSVSFLFFLLSLDFPLLLSFPRFVTTIRSRDRRA